ncbi:hypothetical protein CC1G_10727 [Coprinopsis cinerea okayama7|uniref:Uncharacterized protein n=1 Tax=Coprinopsis cinerea (strain Okayama-7 / 130 / ATCC MYA-4618 / FGSC 9003) TaxID=240176 RepID=A8P373_COPC7|nr:hypothetical protein CC1G_10727 [Coprinopsis cinerea okayama7\|eukprot:XP_001838485.2 hypothetical protein CC1G_10727 [Coprinopsis cinerea okayama7\
MTLRGKGLVATLRDNGEVKQLKKSSRRTLNASRERIDPDSEPESPTPVEASPTPSSPSSSSYESQFDVEMDEAFASITQEIPVTFGLTSDQLCFPTESEWKLPSPFRNPATAWNVMWFQDPLGPSVFDLDSQLEILETAAWNLILKDI